MADATVKILSWDKHNPRKDIKHPAWFALSNRVIDDPKLFALSGDEFKAWVYLLCQASQKNNATVELFFEHAARVGQIPEAAMRSALAKLSSVGVTETLRARTQSVRKRTRTSRDTTLQTLQTDTTQQDTTVTGPPAPVADIDLNRSIWSSYAKAYESRYQTKPVRNAKVNGQVAQLAKRLGSEAPLVAEFYVGHSKSFYISKVHEFGLLLSDAEALRTQWATGQKVTQRQAQQSDDRAAVNDQITRIREGKL